MFKLSNPLLKEIKKQCNGIIQAFDKCLNENETDPEKNCITLLRNLYDCTENVAAKFNKKASDDSQSHGNANINTKK